MRHRVALFVIVTLAFAALLSCALPFDTQTMSRADATPSPGATLSAGQPVPAGGIVVDNAQPGFSVQAGDWGTCQRGECSGDCFGADFRFADSGCTNCRARFDLRVPTAGSYELFVWWPYGDDRATDTPFTIQFSGGANTLNVDQRNNGDDWFWLQTLSVPAGETVSVFVGGTTTGFANADAVALFPTGVSPATPQPQPQTLVAPPTAAPAAAQPTQVIVTQPTQPAAAQPTAPGKPAAFRRIIFLHHSTGQGLIEQSDLRQRLTSFGYEFYDHGYNDDGLTLANGQRANLNFNIPDDNTDPDGFAALFAQPVHSPPDNAFSHLMQYDVIAFKSCFPTSDIQSDEQLAEYKTYYLNIRAVMDRFPNKIFIVVTPPPNVPSATSPEAAARARAWANWLKSPEYLNGHPNVFTFDFFNRLAEGNPLAGDNNMLRAAYRADPNDSHPNERANREIGPQFADFIAQAIGKYK